MTAPSDLPADDLLSEANLWNPLWAYDLFPPAQSFWNRMPITGEDFQTESSAAPEASQPSEHQDSGSDPDLDPDPNPDSEEEEDAGAGGSEPSESPNPDAEASNGPDLDQDEPNNQGNDNNDYDNFDDPDPDPSYEYSLEDPIPGPPPIPGLTITQTETSLEYLREFNSWEDFVECVADENLYAWKNTRSSHDPNQRNAGAAATWTEAIEMARFRGWPEGRNLLSDLMANIHTKSEAFETWTFDVAGMFPIVPAYLSGDPACMIVDPGTDLRTQHPIIRIDYNHEVSWNITPKDMMTRGAAVLSLANNLEANGFQTELRIVGHSTEIDRRRLKTIAFKYSIVYKRPGQFLDIDRAAYAIAHPSCLRRLCFALLEQHAELEPMFKFGYGAPTHQPVDPESESFGTIFIPGSKGRETEETARTAVMIAAEATTSILNQAEAGN